MCEYERVRRARERGNLGGIDIRIRAKPAKSRVEMYQASSIYICIEELRDIAL